jgi:hypothetical protein
MILKSAVQTFKLLLLVLSLSAITACASNEGAKPDTMEGGSLVGLNYTKNYIHRFSVDESGGGGLRRYGQSGDYCCTMYPKVWTPDLRVTVKWTTSNGDPKSNDATETPHTKNIPIEKYTEPGEVYVVFLPKEEVRVYVWHGVPNGPNYPGSLGEPTDPNESKKVKP